MKKYIILILVSLLISCSSSPEYDLVIRGGNIYNGVSIEPMTGDIAVKGAKIVSIAPSISGNGKLEIDAEGKAVSPGFINMLSWATVSLIHDGKSQSDIRQGVTLEVIGEGSSEGPLNDSMKKATIESQGDIKYDVEWTTLGEYLEYLEKKGVSTNIASFIGHTTVRVHEIGYEDRAPTSEELERMKNLVKQGMEEGAVGLASALIYTPAFYAAPEELIELAKVAAEYDGMYISHLRSEGNTFLEALDELLDLSREANIRSEIYHFKAAGNDNWVKLDQAIDKINKARDEGLQITADMYTYPAGATGLNAAMPPWVQEGGYEAWAERLKDPEIRKRVIQEMKTPTNEWENLLLASGTPDRVLLVSFKNEELRNLTGKSLAEVAEMRGKSPEETAIDLVIEDGSRVGTVYFIMSEENVKKKTTLSWMSICSDAGSLAPEGLFLNSNPHPRAYGSFARFLGKYVREEQALSLGEAIRRLTSFPANNLKLRKRGRLEEGYYADIVIFDPAEIKDNATFEKPHQYATGMEHVFVNGIHVLKDGEHTGATPGKVVRGPGWNGWK